MANKSNNNSSLPKIQQVFTSTTSWTVPASLTRVFVAASAGGGGGGSGYPGTGGGGGGAFIGWMSVTPGETITFTIGAGGAASSAGGTTSWTAGGVNYVLNGGQPGYSGGFSYNYGRYGISGSNINSYGTPGAGGNTEIGGAGGLYFSDLSDTPATFTRKLTQGQRPLTYSYNAGGNAASYGPAVLKEGANPGTFSGGGGMYGNIGLNGAGATEGGSGGGTGQGGVGITGSFPNNNVSDGGTGGGGGALQGNSLGGSGIVAIYY